MLTAAERDELAALRVRAYGAGGTSLDAVEAARLEDLESRRVAAVTSERESAGAPASVGDAATNEHTERPSETGADPAVNELDQSESGRRPEPSRRRRFLTLAGAALATGLLGASLGAWIASGGSASSGGIAQTLRYPELAYERTVEDELPEEGFSDVIDRDTTRFVAYVDDAVVWLAIAEDRGGICLLVLADRDTWSAECGGAEVSLVVGDTTFSARPADVAAAEGEFRLSPSVTMTVAE